MKAGRCHAFRYDTPFCRWTLVSSFMAERPQSNARTKHEVSSFPEIILSAYDGNDFFTLDSSSLALVLVFWLLSAAFWTRKCPHFPALVPLYTRLCRLSLPFCGKQAAERRGVWLAPRQETGMARKGGLLGQTLRIAPEDGRLGEGEKGGGVGVLLEVLGAKVREERKNRSFSQSRGR